MINCDVCEKGFKYNYLLLKHLERKIPCQRPINKNCNRSYEGDIENSNCSIRNSNQSIISDSISDIPSIISNPSNIQINNPSIISNPSNIQTNNPSNISNTQCFECEYCSNKFTRKYTLNTHYKKCKMIDDPVRELEIELCKNVPIDPESKSCRFCNKVFYNLNNLHRHDKTCKMKQEYKEGLLKELNRHKQQNTTTTNNATVPNITINIDNSHNIHNNTMNIMNYDHNYEHITIENIIKCLKISKEKREDAIASLGRFIRESDKNDRSVIVSNLRCKNVKAFEDGEYVTKDARTVIANRGQEAAYRLDSAKEEVGEEHHPLWHKKDFGDIEATLSMATYSTTDKDANKIYEAVKMAIYDANKLLRNT